MNITILAFNYGYAGRFVNGPGMCLVNFVKFLNKEKPESKIKIFTVLKPAKNDWHPARQLKDDKTLYAAIANSDVVHVWSGMTSAIIKAVNFANKLDKKVIIGPNVLDTVEFKKEERFLSKIRYDRVLAVNQRLLFKIAKEHNISPSVMSVYMVGPDVDLWSPSDERDGTILWKGNGRQYVKDVGFARKVEKKLRGKYKFKFIGDPRPYDYFGHIKEAKKSKLMIVTSLSETMGLAMMESWCAGTPSVSHPKIYMHGENYKTGIITNKTADEYCNVIEEIMENDSFYQYLSLECKNFISKNFSAKVTIEKYMKILEGGYE